MASIADSQRAKPTGYDKYVSYKPFAVAVVLSVIAWFFEGLGYWIILHVFEAPPTMLKAMFIYSFSTVVGAVSMLPGGLGTTETSLTGLAQLAGATKDEHQAE